MKKWSLIVSVILFAGVGSSVLAQTQPEVPKSPRGVSQKVIASVELYTKKQDSAGAIKGLNEAVEKDPKNYYANAWLGYLYMEAGDYASAIRPLEVAHATLPSDIGVLNNLAHSIDRSGDKERAYTTYQELNKAKPGDAVVLNRLGVLALDRGQTATAISYFEEADKASPGDKLITTNLAMAYTRDKQTDKAKAAYERLVALNPDNETMVTSLSWLGFNAIQSGQYGDAIGYLERAVSLRDNDLEILNNLAMAYSNVVPAQEVKALDTYRKMVALNPNIYEPWYNLGVLYLKQNKPDEAIEANENALKRKPNEPFALNNLGRAYELNGRFAMAGDNYAAASNIDPKNVVFAHNAATAYAKAKQDDKAATYINRAMSLGDNDPDLTLILGDIYARQGKTAEAVVLMEKASDRVTDRADLWFNLGVMKEKLGKRVEAEECYRKCLAIKPDDIDANTNLALILLNRGDWKNATPIMEKVMGINSSSVDAKLNVAAAYYRGGRTKDAVELWKTVLQASPSRTDVRLNLANTLWSMKDYEGAYNHFSIALRDAPNNAQALNGVGLWYLRASKNADAEKSFRGAIKADQKYMPPYNNLAVTLERLNRRKEAIAVLGQALKIDPNFEDARKNLQRMKSSEN